MSIDPNELSIVHWFPNIEKHKCGYCKQENSSVFYGMWAETMSVEDYQNLIDRGWRRCGKYCYKPIMDQTCCPQYTIRCDALNFKISKSQKKVIKKFNKYLVDGILNKDCKTYSADEDSVGHSTIIHKERPNFTIDFNKLNDKILLNNSEDLESGIKPSCSQKATEAKEVQEPKKELRENVNDVKRSPVKKGLGADPNKPPCKKAKLIRLEAKQKKLLEKGLSLEKMETGNRPKTLMELINDIPDKCKHRLVMKLVSTSNPSDEFIANINVEYDVYRKYQMIVHNDPPEKCTPQGFQRFLVTTPLKCEDDDDDDEVGFGSFHQQYWIDNQLIAVGVLDILPRCISSVYFFYDPDYRNLTLGTYGSIREVEFTRSLNEKIPSIKHYYMGFYIHSCPKMRYKGKLKPSDLLCPETYVWFPIEKCIPKLEMVKYVKFNDDSDVVDKDICSETDVDNIRVLLGYSYTSFKYYKYRNREKETFENIGRLIGKKCARTMLFVGQSH